MWTVIIVFILSFFLLAKSGAMLVGALTYLARIFKMSEYTIAFVLMSFGTSVAELFVGVSSAIGKAPGLSLGNILGANVINITLVIGVVAILNKELKIDSKISKNNFWLVAGIGLLPALLIADGVISRGDGLVLIFAFAAYIWRVLGEREYFTKIINDVAYQKSFVSKSFKNLGKFFTSVAMLIISSALLVWSGKILAGGLDLNNVVFGIIFIALGTTLPELAFGIRAALLNHSSMSVGNSLGSIAFNAAFILGIVSIVSPIKADVSSIMTPFAFLVAAFALFNVFLYSRNYISRREGFLLVLIYIAFAISEYYIAI